MEARQNEEIINSTHSLRVFKHDIMNHMSILYKLVENGKWIWCFIEILLSSAFESFAVIIQSMGIIPVEIVYKLVENGKNSDALKYIYHLNYLI